MFSLTKFKTYLPKDLAFDIGSAYRIVIFSLIIFSSLVTLYCLPLYPGNKLIYILFCFCYISLLAILLFKEKFYFIDLFFAFYLWIGFWLKLILYIYDTHKFLIQNVGRFSFEIPKLDAVLLISILCYFSFLSAIFIRRKFFPANEYFSSAQMLKNKLSLYENMRAYIIFAFIFTVLLLTFINYQYSIFQRGVPFAELNFLLLGAFKWLLQFGFASFALFIANEEFKLSKNLTIISLIVLTEIFFTNISTLSRGAVISGSPYLLCLFLSFPRIRLSKFILTGIITLFVFVFSASISNHLRHIIFSAAIFSPSSIVAATLPTPVVQATLVNQAPLVPVVIENKSSLLMEQINDLTFPDLKIHIVDRIIGIEGIMAMDSYNGKGWPLFLEAINESSASSGTSFYDKRILISGYLQNTEKFLFANLMGVFAFLYYPGSYPFIFFSFIFIYLFFSSIEYASWRFGGRNIFFSCLVGHVLAYRLVHFGYAPKQTYMLILTLIANIFIFYFLLRLLKRSTND